jgi:tRNA(Ile)-lysidine synthase
MNLLLQFEAFIKQTRMFEKSDHLLLAVSGGVDSSVLCELCSKSGYEFTIAQCNFQLRGKESERDEEFVRSLGKKYSVEVLVKKFDTEKYATEKKVSIQVAARELRYAWFHEILDSKKLKCIVTAHHLDDNIETLLMNFFKGTGISGLRGMLPQTGRLARPLLFARKEELLQFAKESQLDWVEDSSNQSDKYSRNYLRHQLIRVIEKLYPSVIENLGNNIERFRELEKFHNEAVQLQLKKLVEVKGEEVQIPILKLKKMASVKTIIYELISLYGFAPAAVEEVVHLLESETGKYVLSSSHRILKNRNWLIISPRNPEKQEQVVVEKGEGSIRFQNGELILKKKAASNTELVANNGKALIDEEKINFPLLLRKWRPGDYFYPLGMTKKKKLARFFIDQKLSLAQKEKTWVIEMNKKIVWVVGLRIDDRFKVTNQTKKVLEITFDQNVLI